MSKQGENPEKHTHVLEDGTIIEHIHGAAEAAAPHDGAQGKTAAGHTHSHGEDAAGHTHSHGEGNAAHTHSHGEDAAGHAHSHGEDTAGHTHSHGGGNAAHTHGHGAQGVGHAHSHTHTHDPEQVKSVLNRISRAIGHLESIKRMVEDGRDCSEVLIQLSAVKAAINNTGKVILQNHIAHCLVDAVETGDMETIEELNKAIDRFIK